MDDAGYMRILSKIGPLALRVEEVQPTEEVRQTVLRLIRFMTCGPPTHSNWPQPLFGRIMSRRVSSLYAWTPVCARLLKKNASMFWGK